MLLADDERVVRVAPAGRATEVHAVVITVVEHLAVVEGEVREIVAQRGLDVEHELRLITDEAGTRDEEEDELLPLLAAVRDILLAHGDERVGLEDRGAEAKVLQAGPLDLAGGMGDRLRGARRVVEGGGPRRQAGEGHRDAHVPRGERDEGRSRLLLLDAGGSDGDGDLGGHGASFRKGGWERTVIIYHILLLLSI